MARPPARIAIVGRAGSGKTTVARELGRRLDLPVVHLDALFWTADWKEVDRDVFEARQANAVRGERWIVDGGYLSSRGWPERLRRAELVVVTEAPLAICLWRVMRRLLRRGDRRADRPDGAHEQFSPRFLWWVATWQRRHPDLARRIAAAAPEMRVLVVRRLEDLADITPSAAMSSSA